MDIASFAFPFDATKEPIPGFQSGVADAKPGPSVPSKTQSPAVNRPPKLPSHILGPYYQFLTTTEDKKWLGSALTLHKVGTPEPVLSFDHECNLAKTILYEDVFDMVAIRWDLEFNIPDGDGDEVIEWEFKWNSQHHEKGRFHIARMDEKWRGGFFSCNGFDETVPEGVVKAFGFANVWNHMNSVHEDVPLHAMIWGGDQIYIYFIFKDIPFLKRWTQEMEYEVMYKHEFSEEVSRQCANYYFCTYAENWERPEVKRSLQTCPAIMSWDDHDMFDGAGSYPDYNRLSPVMLGLMRTAQKFRLLFQHQTTLKHYKQHRLFGKISQNSVVQMGPRLACLVTDGRTERCDKTIIEEESWNMMFERLSQLPPTTKHLMVIFAVPFSFIRVKVAERAFEFLKNRAPWVRFLPGLKGQQSIFGLPELYDDLLDEWTHDAHIEERDRALVRFQGLAKAQQLRVTFISGDVHCAAVSRFRTDAKTRKATDLKPENDHRLMYQMIASAIVNQSPSPNACIGYHYIRNKWHPVANTSEGLVECFERRPEQGKHVRHRKVMPNRNWMMWNEIGAKSSSGGQDTAYEFHDREDTDEINHPPRDRAERSSTHSRASLPEDLKDHRHIKWHSEHYLFDKKKGYPSTLGPTSKSNGTGYSEPPLHQHGHGIFCRHKGKKSKTVSELDPAKRQEMKVDDMGDVPVDEPVPGLRMRIWLESRDLEPAGRQFASYEIMVPGLSEAKA